jgi:hypothetical protein
MLLARRNEKMKKILAISMVLVLMIGAAFAAEPSTTSTVVTATVSGGAGVTGSIADATLGDGTTFGYYIYYADDNKISDSTEGKATDKSAAVADSYTFKVKYLGKEAANQAHTITVSSTPWYLDGTVSSDTDKSNAMTSLTAGISTTGHESIVPTASGAVLTTTFGQTQNTPVATEVPVGTFTLAWGNNDALQVGTYKATVTFTLADV